MSINLGGTPTATTNAAIVSYDTAVKLSYQGGANSLRGSVNLKTGVVGAVHNFRKVGAAVAYQQTTSAEMITPNDTSHTKVPATLTNWRVGDYTDLFDQAETTVDERALLAANHGLALNRREDQLIIDALDAATSIAGTVDEDLAGTNSLINATKLRRAKTYLLAQQGAGSDHFFLINASGMYGALAETQVTSADYQTMKVLVDADLADKKAFGFTFKLIEDRVEGGLPTGSTSIRLCFAYDKQAVGLAVAGMEQESSVDFIPERRSWLSQSALKAGATVIDSKGVVEVQSYES